MATANVGLLLDEGRIIKASKTAIINVESSNEKMSFLTISIDSIVPRMSSGPTAKGTAMREPRVG